MTIAEKLLKVSDGIDKTAALNGALGRTLYGTDEVHTLDANVAQAASDFAAIKNSIVDKGIKVGDKTSDYASKIDEVYASGQRSEYDRFWDIYQANEMYIGAFAGDAWGYKQLFKPKYDMHPRNASYMFYSNTMGGDLVEYLDSLGIILDFENCNNANSVFQYSKFTRVGKIYNVGVSWYSTFYGCSNLVTIDEMGHPTGGIVDGGLTTTFTYCEALENIKVKGTFINNVNFHWCTKLTHDSLMSIINALSDTVQGRTLSLGATNIAKLSEAEKALITQKGWKLV